MLEKVCVCVANIPIQLLCLQLPLGSFLRHGDKRYRLLVAVPQSSCERHISKDGMRSWQPQEQTEPFQSPLAYVCFERAANHALFLGGSLNAKDCHMRAI